MIAVSLEAVVSFVEEAGVYWVEKTEVYQAKEAVEYLVVDLTRIVLESMIVSCFAWEVPKEARHSSYEGQVEIRAALEFEIAPTIPRG